MAEAEQFEFDVALSFAGENRETVAAIAQCLQAHGVRVFYDDFQKTNPPSIRGVAVAPVGMDVVDVDDAASLDYTSRVRSPRLGQVVVLENVNGFLAALRLTSIKDSTRWDGPDELAFDYWILRDGSRDFSTAVRL
jgi:hypothetical protein